MNHMHALQWATEAMLNLAKSQTSLFLIKLFVQLISPKMKVVGEKKLSSMVDEVLKKSKKMTSETPPPSNYCFSSITNVDEEIAPTVVWSYRVILGHRCFIQPIKKKRTKLQILIYMVLRPDMRMVRLTLCVQWICRGTRFLSTG